MSPAHIAWGPGRGFLGFLGFLVAGNAYLVRVFLGDLFERVFFIDFPLEIPLASHKNLVPVGTFEKY